MKRTTMKYSSYFADRYHKKGPGSYFVVPVEILLALAFVLLVPAVSSSVVAHEEKIACESFRQAGLDPQKVFDISPEKYKRLDKDKDFKVCE